MKTSFLFISCQEAFLICDKAQYGDATLWERIKLSIRLSWCRISRAYSKKNNELTETINEANICALSPQEREEMQAELKAKLENQNQK